MADNTSKITELITSFRQLQSPDSITPESLGYLLQQILDNHDTDIRSYLEDSTKIWQTLTPLTTDVATLKGTVKNHGTQLTEIKQTADAAKEVTDSKGKADGIAPLDENRQIASRYLPNESWQVLEFDEVVSDPDRKIQVKEGVGSISPGQQTKLVWIDYGDGTGQFADYIALYSAQPEQEIAPVLDSIVTPGDIFKTGEYYASFANQNRYIDSNGKPLAGKLYRCIADGTLYALSPDGTGLAKLFQSDFDRASRKAFIDLFNHMAGANGKYDYENAPDKSKPFYLNKLWLSYEEALEVVARGKTTYFHPQMVGANCRTNILCTETKQLNAGMYPYFALEGAALHINAETLRFADDGAECCPKTVGTIAVSCGKLREVLGVIDVRNATNLNSVFLSCPSLEEFRLKQLKINIRLNSSWHISYESFKFLVDNAANTAAITITVHKTVYAALTGEASEYPFNGATKEQWLALLETAYSKNISFATV